MAAVLGIILGLVAVFGPYIGIPLIYERYRPHATVGEVGPLILLAYLIEIILLFALMAAGS